MNKSLKTQPYPSLTSIVDPVGSMRILSNLEVQKLQDTSNKGLHKIFRQCALAVLSNEFKIDDSEALLKKYKSFDINILQEHSGLKLELINAPKNAFVDGSLIKGIHENLFSVLRDILYVNFVLRDLHSPKTHNGPLVTNLIFSILRNAKAFNLKKSNHIVVCWGGHSISDEEYQYTKKIGYQLGLRDIEICTGCGPGAMKGPMKGAYIGQIKQRDTKGQFIGLTEPSIIAAEAPNPIVNKLIILPDIEKRLEAFVRIAHNIVVFPGGAGTCEEILYLIGIMLHPSNSKISLPIILTGPASTAEYFKKIDKFIGTVLGKKAQSLYKIIIDNPLAVAKATQKNIATITKFRKKEKDAHYFNWMLNIPEELQIPFKPTHKNMSELIVSKKLPSYQLAANIRKLMSGIVAGNIKEKERQSIRKHGPYHLSGDQEIMTLIDNLLIDFTKQHRMKLPGQNYKPCYVIEPLAPKK